MKEKQGWLRRACRRLWQIIRTLLLLFLAVQLLGGLPTAHRVRKAILCVDKAQLDPHDLIAVDYSRMPSSKSQEDAIRVIVIPVFTHYSRGCKQVHILYSYDVTHADGRPGPYCGFHENVIEYRWAHSGWQACRSFGEEKSHDIFYLTLAWFFDMIFSWYLH